MPLRSTLGVRARCRLGVEGGTPPTWVGFVRLSAQVSKGAIVGTGLSRGPEAQIIVLFCTGEICDLNSTISPRISFLICKMRIEILPYLLYRIALWG